MLNYEADSCIDLCTSPRGLPRERTPHDAEPQSVSRFKAQQRKALEDDRILWAEASESAKDRVRLGGPLRALSQGGRCRGRMPPAPEVRSGRGPSRLVGREFWPKNERLWGGGGGADVRGLEPIGTCSGAPTSASPQKSAPRAPLLIEIRVLRAHFWPRVRTAPGSGLRAGRRAPPRGNSWSRTPRHTQAKDLDRWTTSADLRRLRKCVTPVAAGAGAPDLSMISSRLWQRRVKADGGAPCCGAASCGA